MSTNNNSAQAHDLISMATELSEFSLQFNGHDGQLRMIGELPDHYAIEQADAALKSLSEVMTKEATLLTRQLPELAKAEFWGVDNGDRHHNATAILNMFRAHRQFTSEVLEQFRKPPENSLTIALDNAINTTEQQLKAF